MKSIFRPTNQAECDHANALREYKAAHKTWMNASVFTEDGKQAKTALGAARHKYIEATKAAHPSWIVF
jgi:hypothetical protein